MQSHRPHRRDHQPTNPISPRGAARSFGSSVGTDSSVSQTFNTAGGFGFAQESESAIEADASTVDEDSDSTTMLSGSNNPINSANLDSRPTFSKKERWSQNHATSSLSDRAIPSVDSDASFSPTFEKSTFTGSHSLFNAESRKPVATDIPTPSSGYQADTEILETEESHTVMNPQHHHQHHQHHHTHNQYSSSMDYQHEDTDN
jgi:hypothetical protein